MADPNNIDDALKVGGGASAAAIIVAIGRLFSGSATTQRLDAMARELGELHSKVTVLVMHLERHIHEEERTDAERRLLALEERQRAHERLLEEIRATLKDLSEGLVR